jgi:uncharacterized protein YqjF (DUF2071 family)
LSARPFLTAEWRYLAMLNYAVSPALVKASLAPLVPAGTELDQLEGKTYLSLVGFRFLRTRVRGLWIPFHSSFDEVNLRFYVKRQGIGSTRQGIGPARRGVVFVREIVPRFAIAKVAQVVYHEKYIALPMSHQVIEPTSEHGRVQAEYRWRYQGQWNRLRVACAGRPALAPEGSLQQFITEHYWGYGAQPDGGSLEYQVAHDPWRVWTATQASFQSDTHADYPTGLYGPELARCLSGEPDSAFLAEGSAVTVYSGNRIE